MLVVAGVTHQLRQAGSQRAALQCRQVLQLMAGVAVHGCSRLAQSSCQVGGETCNISVRHSQEEEGETDSPAGVLAPIMY